MSAVELVGLGEPGRWREALRGIPHGFAHTWESCHAHHLTTGHETFLLCIAADGVRVACPVAERPLDGRADVVTPYGFSGFSGTGPCRRLPELWARFARDRGYVCGYIGLSPLFGDPTYADAADVHPNKHVYLLDLTRSEAELHAALSTNRRRQLRGWDPAAHDLDRERLVAFFLAEYPRFMARKDAGSQFAFSTATLEAICRLPNVFLLGAEGHDGTLEAVSVFAHTPDAGDFLLNAALTGAARHSTHLLWSAAHRLRGLGVPSLNLGGGVAEGDSLAQFKERFGARKLPLAALKQVYDRAAYERLCRERGADPDDIEGYFPPYRRPARVSAGG
ncbi:MAG TPA: hypothetical protein VGP78_08685 [Solirubrobacteraceae bacterium]|nr:hypothetical protein [Solirubrobacteraceae bacterium]